MNLNRYITFVEDEGLREILEILQDQIETLKERVAELEERTTRD